MTQRIADQYFYKVLETKVYSLLSNNKNDAEVQLRAKVTCRKAMRLHIGLIWSLRSWWTGVAAPPTEQLRLSQQHQLQLLLLASTLHNKTQAGSC